MPKVSGTCLCGAVSLEGDGEAIVSVACHCTHCRKSSGSGHGAYWGFPAQSVSVDGEVRVFISLSDRGTSVRRAFCPTCGSPVWSDNDAMPGVLMLRPSILDDAAAFQPQFSVFASRAVAWDPVRSGTPVFERLPPGFEKQA